MQVDVIGGVKSLFLIGIWLAIIPVLIVDTVQSINLSSHRQMCFKLQAMLSYGKYQTIQMPSNITYESRVYAQNFLAYSPIDNLLIFIEPKHQVHVYNAQTVRPIVNLTTNDIVIASSSISLLGNNDHELFFIYETRQKPTVVAMRICQVRFNFSQLIFEQLFCISTLTIRCDRSDIRISGFAIKRDHGGTSKSLLFISTDLGLIYVIFDTQTGVLNREPMIMNDTLNDGNVVVTSSGSVYYANKEEHIIYELHITKDFRIRYGKIIKSNAIKHPFGLIADECNHLYIATKSMILVMFVQTYTTIRSVFSKASDLPITIERINSSTYIYPTIIRKTTKGRAIWMFNFLHFNEPEKPPTSVRFPAVDLDEKFDYNETDGDFSDVKLWPISPLTSLPDSTTIRSEESSVKQIFDQSMNTIESREAQTTFSPLSSTTASQFDENMNLSPISKAPQAYLPKDTSHGGLLSKEPTLSTTDRLFTYPTSTTDVRRQNISDTKKSNVSASVDNNRFSSTRSSKDDTTRSTFQTLFRTSSSHNPAHIDERTEGLFPDISLSIDSIPFSSSSKPDIQQHATVSTDSSQANRVHASITSQSTQDSIDSLQYGSTLRTTTVTAVFPVRRPIEQLPHLTTLASYSANQKITSTDPSVDDRNNVVQTDQLADRRLLTTAANQIIKATSDKSLQPIDPAVLSAVDLTRDMQYATSTQMNPSLDSTPRPSQLNDAQVPLPSVNSSSQSSPSKQLSTAVDALQSTSSEKTPSSKTQSPFIAHNQSLSIIDDISNSPFQSEQKDLSSKTTVRYLSTFDTRLPTRLADHKITQTTSNPSLSLNQSTTTTTDFALASKVQSASDTQYGTSTQINSALDTTRHPSKLNDAQISFPLMSTSSHSNDSREMSTVIDDLRSRFSQNISSSNTRLPFTANNESQSMTDDISNTPVDNEQIGVSSKTTVRYVLASDSRLLTPPAGQKITQTTSNPSLSLNQSTTTTTDSAVASKVEFTSYTQHPTSTQINSALDSTRHPAKLNDAQISFSSVSSSSHSNDSRKMSTVVDGLRSRFSQNISSSNTQLPFTANNESQSMTDDISTTPFDHEQRGVSSKTTVPYLSASDRRPITTSIDQATRSTSEALLPTLDQPVTEIIYPSVSSTIDLSQALDFTGRSSKLNDAQTSFPLMSTSSHSNASRDMSTVIDGLRSRFSQNISFSNTRLPFTANNQSQSMTDDISTTPFDNEQIGVSSKTTVLYLSASDRRSITTPVDQTTRSTSEKLFPSLDQSATELIDSTVSSTIDLSQALDFTRRPSKLDDAQTSFPMMSTSSHLNASREMSTVVDGLQSRFIQNISSSNTQLPLIANNQSLFLTDTISNKTFNNEQIDETPQTTVRYHSSLKPILSTVDRKIDGTYTADPDESANTVLTPLSSDQMHTAQIEFDRIETSSRKRTETIVTSTSTIFQPQNDSKSSETTNTLDDFWKTRIIRPEITKSPDANIHQKSSTSRTDDMTNVVTIKPQTDPKTKRPFDKKHFSSVSINSDPTQNPLNVSPTVSLQSLLVLSDTTSTSSYRSLSSSSPLHHSLALSISVQSSSSRIFSETTRMPMSSPISSPPTTTLLSSSSLFEPSSSHQQSSIQTTISFPTSDSSMQTSTNVVSSSSITHQQSSASTPSTTITTVDDQSSSGRTTDHDSTLVEAVSSPKTTFVPVLTSSNALFFSSYIDDTSSMRTSPQPNNSASSSASSVEHSSTVIIKPHTSSESFSTQSSSEMTMITETFSSATRLQTSLIAKHSTLMSTPFPIKFETPTSEKTRQTTTTTTTTPPTTTKTTTTSATTMTTTITTATATTHRSRSRRPKLTVAPSSSKSPTFPEQTTSNNIIDETSPSISNRTFIWRSKWDSTRQQPLITIKPSTSIESNTLLSTELFNSLFNKSAHNGSIVENRIRFDLSELPHSSWNISLQSNASILLEFQLPPPTIPSDSNTTTNLTFTDIEAHRFATNIIGTPVNVQVDRVEARQFSLIMDATDPNRDGLSSDVIIGHVKSEQFELNLTKSDNMHVHVRQVDSATAELYIDDNFCTTNSSLQINLNLSKNGTIRYGDRAPLHIGPVFTRVHMLQQSCDRDQPLVLFFDICERSNPCANGGTCVSLIPDFNDTSFSHPETAHIGYRCICPSHVSGENCQQLEYPLGYCLNGGTLVRIETTRNPIEHCLCSNGFNGTHCEENIDNCLGIDCSKQGVCMDGIGSYRCSCFHGFFGLSCEQTEVQTIILQTASKSFGILAILLIAGIGGLAVASDIHTYLTTRHRRQNSKKKLPRASSELYENADLLRGFSDVPIEMIDLSTPVVKQRRLRERIHARRQRAYRRLSPKSRDLPLESTVTRFSLPDVSDETTL